MLGKRFQRTTSMAQIRPAVIHTANPASAEQHPPSSEQQQQPTISQWELLKHAEEMVMMMMAAANTSGSGSSCKPNGSVPPVRMSGTGGGASSHGEAAALQQSELIPRVSFLDNCYFCQRRLKHERDIFIYRGDAAFCTEECRQRQILTDEARAIGAAANKKGAATSETAVAA